MGARTHVFVSDVVAEAPVPKTGILSRTLHVDEDSKVLVFAFDTDQELSSHTSPFPALLYFVQGEGWLGVGGQRYKVQPGSLLYMAPFVEHSVHAGSPMVMLLVLFRKGHVGGGSPAG